MSNTTADVHRDWHAVNGWNNGCPLDCAAADNHGQDQVDWFDYEATTDEIEEMAEMLMRRSEEGQARDFGPPVPVWF